MFRHQGKTRTAKHNLQIASVLSFVAGIVNVAGFLSVKQLTTNVTGHFAFFVDEIFQFNFLKSIVFFLYIFCFLFGAFVSGFILESKVSKMETNTYVYPVFIEVLLLFFVAFFGSELKAEYPNIIAYILLFAMGLQNALVTKISNSIVRTTHLTGLFTDLGIELAQLFFYKQLEPRASLISSIKLRLTIIFFFFSGGVFCGLLYQIIDLNVLYIAGFTLIFGLIFDNLKLKLILLNRRLQLL